MVFRKALPNAVLTFSDSENTRDLKKMKTIKNFGENLDSNSKFNLPRHFLRTFFFARVCLKRRIINKR
jgi:hypothetical protein